MGRAKEDQRCRKPVGLTGGIGSGKSSVARFCAQQFGVTYIDADQVCRQLLAPHAQGWQGFVATFGKEFLDSQQRIDRQRLREAIFRDPGLRRQLDELVHPLARREIGNQLAAIDVTRCLVEVPLLYEAGWVEDFRAVIVVSASTDCCLARLMQRDQVSRAAALEALAAQMPLSEKARLADYLIDNSGSWQETCQQLLQLEKLFQGRE